MKKLCVMVCFMTLSLLLFGQGSINEVRPISNKLLLQNVNLVQDGNTAANQDILIEGGIIMMVGSDLAAPPDAELLDCKNMYAYPAFIAAATSAGFKAPKTGGYKPKNPGQPDPSKVGINPDRSALEYLNTSDKALSELKNQGFGLLHVLPQRGMMPGKGVVVSLADTAKSNAVVVNDASFAATYDGSGSWTSGPATAIGVIAKFKDLYHQAKQRMDYEKRYADNPAGMQRLEKSNLHEALYPVITKDLTVFYDTESYGQVHRALALQKDFDFDLCLTNVEYVNPVLQHIKTAGVPVLLSLNLPKEAAKVSMDTLDSEQKSVYKKKTDLITAMEANANALDSLQIPFSYSLQGLKAKDFKKNLQRIKQAGVDEDLILKALTVNAATITGTSAIAGSIEKGKMGNVMIVDEPFFNDDAAIRYMVVEGALTTYEEKKKKKEEEKVETNDKKKRSKSKKKPKL